MADIIYPELSYKVQGAFFEIHNALHHLGLSEAGWEKALMIALADRGIAAQSQVEHALHYKEHRIARFFIDVVADDKLVIEIKVAEALEPIHKAQVLAYLKVSGLRLGILVNFGGERVVFERVPNFISQRPATADRQDGSSNAAEGLIYPKLTGELRNILYEVHNELGPGWLPMHYRRACQVELRLRDLPFEKLTEIMIQYRGQPIEQRDVRLLMVDRKVLLAPVTAHEVTAGMRTRLHYHLSVLNLKLGLIANFHAASLEIEPVRI
jgi:GxxExxY protein